MTDKVRETGFSQSVDRHLKPVDLAIGEIILQRIVSASEVRHDASQSQNPGRGNFSGQLNRFLWHDAEAAQVALALFEATERFQANRLPELFAGLPRDAGGFPVQYLGASVPQAWAAGSIFRFVATLCGIHATSDLNGSRLYVDPALPDWLPELTIRNLRAGNGAAVLRFHDSEVEILSNTTGFEIVHGPAPRPTR